jgi:hypothetical protein
MNRRKVKVKPKSKSKPLYSYQKSSYIGSRHWRQKNDEEIPLNSVPQLVMGSPSSQRHCKALNTVLQQDQDWGARIAMSVLAVAMCWARTKTKICHYSFLLLFIIRTTTTTTTKNHCYHNINRALLFRPQGAKSKLSLVRAGISLINFIVYFYA